MSWRTLLAWSIYPVIVIGGVAAGIIAMDAGMPPPLVIGGLGGAAMLVVAVLERLTPYVAAWNRSHGDVRADALHMLVSGIGATELVTVVTLGALAGVVPWLAEHTGWSSWSALWPDTWPLVGQLALALVAGELGIYGAHRLLHQRPLLWRLHAVHHSAERLYWLNASRSHPLDVVVKHGGFMVIVALLGAPETVIAAAALFTAVHAPLQHSNVAVRAGPFNLLLATAELHRWHHAPGSAANVNYGGNLILWDLVFRTYHRPPGVSCTEVGLGESGGPAGDASRAAGDFPRNYLGHLASPWRWWA